MFTWLKGDDDRKKPADVFNSVVDGIKKTYKRNLLPLEEAFQFGQFHSPYMSDGDFDAKPMVLLIGQYSTGKTTFIRYLLERDFPGIRIGPEPTTDRFVAVMHGPNDQSTPGNALAHDPSKQFRALQQFGSAFLQRFEASTLPSPVLESITLVDTPGILSGEKQRLQRGYSFEAVMEWFADRADRIVLLFDAHKLDISDEFRRVIDMIKKNPDKIRIVLNKSDMITTQQLMRVYGALMWSLGKIMGTPEVVRVYIGSFWDRPLQNDENRRLFEAEQEDLFADFQSLPRTAAVRKVNELIKRAKLAKVHAIILNHLRSEMPSLFYKQSKKEQLIGELHMVFNTLHRKYSIPVGDFPNVKRMQSLLVDYDFTRFQKLNQTMLDNVDRMLSNDIVRLMAMLPKEEEMAKDARIKGGVFGHVNFGDEPDPFAKDYHLSGVGDKDGWAVSGSVTKYDAVFHRLRPNPQGKISGAAAREEMLKSKLPNSVLRRIWNLSDIDKDGMLDGDEFAVCMFLVDLKIDGHDLPEELPPNLIPPSKRMILVDHHYEPTLSSGMEELRYKDHSRLADSGNEGDLGSYLN
jgi:GTPase SAR1 family protein